MKSRLKTPPTEKQIALASRLRELRLYNKLSLKEVSSKIGISDVTLQRYETVDIVNIPSDKIEELAKIYNTTPQVIMGWTDEKNIINELSTFSYTFIPTKVSAGALEDVEAIYECPKIDVPDAMLGKYARDKSIVFIGVNGESMNKVIANGAIIAVKTNVEKESLKDRDIVIASYENEYIMKRFIDNKKGKEFILRPDSTDLSFADIKIPYEDADKLKIFGKVVIYSVVLD